MDYTLLLGKMKEQRMPRYILAKELGWSPETLGKKLKNGDGFTQNQIAIICKLLGIKKSQIVSYFFTKDVRKTEQLNKQL